MVFYLWADSYYMDFSSGSYYGILSFVCLTLSVPFASISTEWKLVDTSDLDETSFRQKTQSLRSHRITDISVCCCFTSVYMTYCTVCLWLLRQQCNIAVVLLLFFAGTHAKRMPLKGTSLPVRWTWLLAERVG